MKLGTGIAVAAIVISAAAVAIWQPGFYVGAALLFVVVVILTAL